MKNLIFIFILFPSFVLAESEHYYSFNDGFEYGYELNGESQLFLVKYLGNRNKVYQLLTVDGIEAAIFECDTKCKYVKVYNLWDAHYQDMSVIKVNQSMVIWQAMQDAQNSRLKQYKRNNGETLWVYGKNGPKWSKKNKK